MLDGWSSGLLLGLPMLAAVASSLLPAWVATDDSSFHLGFWGSEIPGQPWRIAGGLVALVTGLLLVATNPKIGLPRLPMGYAATAQGASLIAFLFIVVGGQVGQDFVEDSGLQVTGSGGSYLPPILLVVTFFLGIYVAVKRSPSGTPYLHR